MPIGAHEPRSKASYFVAAVLFILGLKRMSSPVTARSGIVQAGVGMVVATLIDVRDHRMHNYVLMTVGIAIGVVPTWIWGKQVAMTDMPPRAVTGGCNSLQAEDEQPRGDEE